MSQHKHVPAQTEADVRARRSRRRRASEWAGVAVVGTAALLLGTQVLPASADPAIAPGFAKALSDEEPTPPAGEAWIQGVLTDQAGNPLNNVNVEVWSASLGASVPAASNLTYAGDPDDGRHDSGVFRVAVPAGSPYRLTFSTVGGVEDGDSFRMQSYGGGRPIMARVGGGGAGAADSVAALPGRVVDLGTLQLARQGTVESRTKAKLVHPKVGADQRAKIKVKVSSKLVTDVTGKIQVKVGDKKVTSKLTPSAHGRARVKLPKLAPGTRQVRAVFKGSSTVAHSKSSAVRLTVTKK